MFEASYILGPSFLSKFVKMHAGLAIYRGGNLVKLIPSGQNINWQNSSKFTFSVNGLETDISYTAKPYLEIFDRRFDHNGIPFSSASPTAAITDIVQTGSAKGKFTHYGSEFDYEFYFFINSEIRGSENCREWGIYSPLSVNIWNPNPLQDGRVTQYWTGWSNQTSFVWEATPYAILIGSDDPILYETHSALLSLDGIYSSPRRANGAPGLRTVQGDGFVLRLDSIAYDRPDGVRNILR